MEYYDLPIELRIKIFEYSYTRYSCDPKWFHPYHKCY